MISYLSSRQSACCELEDQPRPDVSYVTVIVALGLRYFEADQSDEPSSTSTCVRGEVGCCLVATVSLQVSGCVRSGGTYDGLDVVRDRGSGGRLCDCLRQERGGGRIGNGCIRISWCRYR